MRVKITDGCGAVVLNMRRPVALTWAGLNGSHRCVHHSILAAASFIAAVTAADAAEMKILTAGAMKAVVLELVPAFEKETGHKAVVDNDTAGGLAQPHRGRRGVRPRDHHAGRHQ